MTLQAARQARWGGVIIIEAEVRGWMRVTLGPRGSLILMGACCLAGMASQGALAGPDCYPVPDLTSFTHHPGTRNQIAQGEGRGSEGPGQEPACGREGRWRGSGHSRCARGGLGCGAVGVQRGAGRASVHAEKVQGCQEAAAFTSLLGLKATEAQTCLALKATEAQSSNKGVTFQTQKS